MWSINVAFLQSNSDNWNGFGYLSHENGLSSYELFLLIASRRYYRYVETRNILMNIRTVCFIEISGLPYQYLENHTTTTTSTKNPWTITDNISHTSMLRPYRPKALQSRLPISLDILYWSTYEDFGARSRYLRLGKVIASYRILWDAITYPRLRYLLLAPQSSFGLWIPRQNVTEDEELGGLCVTPSQSHWLLSTKPDNSATDTSGLINSLPLVIPCGD